LQYFALQTAEVAAAADVRPSYNLTLGSCATYFLTSDLTSALQIVQVAAAAGPRPAYNVTSSVA